MARDFFDGLGINFSKKAKDLSDKAENLYGIQKIKNKIGTEEKTVEKLKFDIGSLVYQRYEEGNAVDGELGELCEEISKHMQCIEKYRHDIADLKDQKICSNCQKTIAKQAAFCPFCGATCLTEEKENDTQNVVELEEETTEETTEETVEDTVKEAVEDSETNV